MAILSDSSRLAIMACLIAVYFVVELVAGYVLNALSLVADSFHMLSDFLAICIGLAAIQISKWPRSPKNTFGWQRAEVMGSLVNCVVLATLCFTILIDAVERLIEREPVERPLVMCGVGVGGLVVNLLGLIILGSHSHSHGNEVEVTSKMGDEDSHLQINIGEDDKIPPGRNNISDSKASQLNGDSHANCHITSCKTKVSKSSRLSLNMRAVFLHVLADFLGSIIVVTSALILHFSPGDADKSWKLFVDPIMSIILIIIILSTLLPLLYKTALILLQSVPDEICLRNLKNRLENIEGVLRVHDLHVWRLQSNCIIGTVHVKVKSLREYVQVARSVKSLFHSYDIHCTTIQPEFVDEEMIGTGLDNELCMFDCGNGRTCAPDKCCPTTNSTSSLIAGQPVRSGKGPASHSSQHLHLVDVMETKMRPKFLDANTSTTAMNSSNIDGVVAADNRLPSQNDGSSPSVVIAGSRFGMADDDHERSTNPESDVVRTLLDNQHEPSSNAASPGDRSTMAEKV